MQALMDGVAFVSVNDLAASGVTEGTAVAVPSAPGKNGRPITWQYSVSTGTLAALSVSLQLSIDGTTWFSADTGTSTTSEVRTVTVTQAKFARAYKNSHTGTGKITVSIMI